MNYECARCGVDVGNGGVDQAAIVTDTHPDDRTAVRQLRFCLDRPDPDHEGRTIQGCRDRVLTKRALAHYHETRTA
jgi:hypothetical protein